MQTLLAKLAKGRKAILAAATQVGAVIVIFVPTWGHGVQVALGLVAALISLALVYRVPNAKEARAVGKVTVHIDGKKVAEGVAKGIADAKAVS